MIRVQINYRYVDVLLDSGASYSVVNWNFAKQRNFQITPLNTNDTSFLIAAGGHHISVLGKARLTLHIGKETITHTFLVVKNLTSAIICGMDCMENKIDLQFSLKQAVINGRTSVPFLPKDTYIGVARLIRGMVIKPGSSRTLALNLPRRIEASQMKLIGFPKPVKNLMIKQHPRGLPLVVVTNKSKGWKSLRRFCPIGNCVKINSLRMDTEIENANKIDEEMVQLPGNKNAAIENREMSLEDPQEARDTLERMIVTEGKLLEDENIRKKEKRARVAEMIPKNRTLDDLGIIVESDNYSNNDLNQFRQVLNDNIDLFAMNNAELPGCSLLEAKFELKDPNAKPTRGRVFNHSGFARNEIDRQVSGLLKDGFIERSKSPWVSPCMLVKKSDSTHRLVIDYRGINDLMVLDRYVPCTLAEIVERVGNAKPKIFSSLDLRSAYQQIVVEQESRKYTAFRTHTGQYQWRRMSFGLASAPGIWCYLMAEVLGDDPLLQKYCIPYLDDLLLFSQTIEEHAELLRRLFKALRLANLRVHSEKCFFLKTEVKYLGHIFSSKGVTACPKKLSAILEFPRPTTKRQVKGFLGMVSFYRAYQADLAKKVTPLNELLKKDQRFQWTQQCETAFQEIREGLRNIPVLSFPDEGEGAGRYVLQVDASNSAVAGTFSQVSRDGQEERLIACYGRTLRPNESRWTISEREGLALMVGILRYKHLLVGNPGLEIRSDNMSVKFLEHITHAKSPRLARWATALSPILTRATWTHVAGQKNVVADALSRRPYEDEEVTSDEREFLYDDMNFALLEAPESLDEDMCFQLISKADELKHEDPREEMEGYQEFLKREGFQTPDQPISDDSEEGDEWCRADNEILLLNNDNNEMNDEMSMDKFIRVITTRLGAQKQKDELLKVPKEKDEGTGLENEIQNEEDKDGEVSPSDLFDNMNDQVVTNATDSEDDADKVMSGMKICGGQDYDLPKLQKECTELGPLITYLVNGELPTDSRKARKLLCQAEYYFLNEDDILCSYKPCGIRREKLRTGKVYTIIPLVLQKEIMHSFHFFGHYGINRMTQMMESASYRWEGMHVDIKNFVLSCKACSISKRGVPAPKAKLKLMEVPSKVGECIHVDVLGRFTPSKSGHVALLSIIDRFSGYIWLHKLRECTSEEIARKLFKVFADIGVVRTIVMDNASNLISKTIQQMADILGIKRIYVAPYITRGNAKVERSHRSIQDALRTLLSEGNYDEWDRKVTSVVFALRSAVSPSTKVSPFQIVHGTPMAGPMTRLLQQQTTTETPPSDVEVSDFVKKLKENIEIIHKVHRQRLEVIQEDMKKRYDETKSRPHTYNVGDIVYLKDPLGKPGVSKKLQTVYFKDRFQILEKQGTHNVKLQNLTTNKQVSQLIHIDRVKLCIERRTEELNKNEVSVTTNVVNKRLTEADPGGTPESVNQSNTGRPNPVDNKQLSETKYNIVEQKGSGVNKQFRIQWRGANGKITSRWERLEDAPQYLLVKWQQSHDASGKTLKTHQKPRKNNM